MDTPQLREDHPYFNGRTCSNCGVFKTTDCFTKEKDARAKDGIALRSQCKPCREHIKWKSFITRTYGITADEYYEILEQQNNSCAICNSTEVSNSRISSNKLFIDHCHETGKVRGLLCSKCNHGLGLFNDDEDLLQKAIDYLINSRKDF